MKLFTTRIFWLVAVLFAVGTISSHAQKNRPLLEEYTGAWCGWCTDGEYTARVISQNNPDVIWVAVHNGDPMAIKEQDTLVSAFIQGFPSSTFDRRPFSGAIATSDRTKWAGNINARLNAPCEATVTLTSTFDKATRKVTAHVDTKFLKAMTGDFGITLYVVEDDITGPSPDYDQHNYLTGRSGYETSPYYKEPGTIPNFHHRYVLREVKGGVWGEQGVITSNPGNGSTFSKDYTFNLNSKYAEANVSLVAFVSQFNSDKKNSPVINSDKVDLIAGTRVSASITAVDNYGTIPANTSGFKTKLNVSSTSTSPITVALKYDETNSDVPANWSIKVNPSTVTIPAKGNVDVDLIIDSDNSGAFAKIHVTAEPQVGSGMVGVQTACDYMVLSEATKNVVVSGFSADPVISGTYLAALKSKTATSSKSAIIPGSADILSKYDLSKFDLIILPVDYSHRGATGDATLATALNDAMTGGKRVIISSELDAWGVATYTTTSQQTKEFYQNNFGITGTTGNPIMRVTVNSSGAITGFNAFSIRGVSGDELGNNINIPTNSPTQAYPYYDIYTDPIKVEAGGPGTPFLYYENQNLVAGVRAQTATSRGIYLSFCPDVIPSGAARSSFMGKLIDWVTAPIKVTPTPDIKISGTTGESVEFGNVEIGKTKTANVVVKNTGTADLVLTKMEIDPEYAGVLSWTTNLTFPITIAAGASQTMVMKFSPSKVEDVYTSCTIVSNAKSADVDGQSIFAISGSGIASTSVEPGLSSDGLLSVSAAPNPVVNQTATVRYNVNSSVPQFVSINVVDELGNNVATLAQSTMAPGSYSVPFDASSVAAGAYRVVVTAGTSRVFVPVVVVK